MTGVTMKRIWCWFTGHQFVTAPPPHSDLRLGSLRLRACVRCQHQATFVWFMDRWARL